MIKTLYIGLGGLGTKVLSEIKKRIKEGSDEQKNTSFIVLDRDLHDLKDQADSGMDCVSLHLHGPVSAYLDKRENKGVREWFLKSPSVIHSNAEYFGNIRAFGRLAFLEALKNGMKESVKSVTDCLMEDAADETELRAVIVTSLSGGTGSGIFIQTALWLRKILTEAYGIQGKICGLFAAPGIFLDSFEMLMRDRSMYTRFLANAYASLKELDIITRIKNGSLTVTPEGISLDGLFDSSEKQDGMPVFDKIYICDKVASIGSSDDRLSEYVKLIAGFALSDFIPNAAEASEAVKKYLASAKDHEEAYEMMCEGAVARNEDRNDPHIDMRWSGIFRKI